MITILIILKIKRFSQCICNQKVEMVDLLDKIWLADQLLVSWAIDGTSSRAFPLQVFREPDACIPNDLREAMDSLCLFVREMSPRTYHLWGILHPAVILHLGVKTQLVSRLSLALRRDYRGLFSAKTIARRPLSHYGLSGMVALPPPRSCPVSEGSSN